MSEKEAPQSTVYTRTLRLAAETLGGADRLARRLAAEQEALERWIGGTEVPPHEVFMRALDIVAGGPLGAMHSKNLAKRAQQHADRMQASANRARETAERAQRSADRAQRHASAQLDRTDPGKKNDAFRQVQPKDGAPASNKPAEKKTSEG